MKRDRHPAEVPGLCAVSVAGTLLFPEFQKPFQVLPLLYLVADAAFRARSWSDLGFLPKQLLADIRKSWFLFLFAGMGSRSITTGASTYMFPAYLDHMRERLPFQQLHTIPAIVVPLGLWILGEELTYRGLYQGTLRKYLSLPAAVILGSAIFASAHYRPAPDAVLIADMSIMFMDGLMYGILYARSGNILAVWCSRFLGEMVGLFFIL